MRTVDYVHPSDDLLRSLPDFPYLDLVPGMPKLRHIGYRTFVRLRRFQPLRKSGFEVATFSEVWILPGSSSRRSTKPVSYLAPGSRPCILTRRFAFGVLAFRTPAFARGYWGQAVLVLESGCYSEGGSAHWSSNGRPGVNQSGHLILLLGLRRSQTLCRTRWPRSLGGLNKS